MKKYEGMLLCTDVDHTLIASDGSLSAESAEAINYFMENGGMFTLSSGRPPLYLTKFHNDFIPNVPVICHNGATLYDYKSAEYIRTVWLNEEKAVKPLMYAIDSYLEYIRCITFYSPNYQRQYNADSTADFTIEKFIDEFSSMKKNKYLISFTSESLAHNVQRTFATDPSYDGSFDFSRSWSYGVEALPFDGNKGSGVVYLKKHLGNVTKTICVGDFENDIPMLKVADIAYAVSNACKDAKDVAHKITVSNDESPIAKVISEL